MSIIQISDLHICEKTSVALLENLRKLKSEIDELPLVICGDIFDKKTYCKGNDIETLHKIFEIFIENQIYIIPGESDFEFGYTTNLLDNLKIEKDNVIVITENTEIKINDKLVLFLPPTDYNKVSKYISNAKKYDYVVMYENNKSKLLESKIPKSQIYLCGGIHTPKKYEIDGNIFAYSGSMSRRFNERNWRKYIKWTDNTAVLHDLVIDTEKYIYYKNNQLSEGELDPKKMTGITHVYVHFRKCDDFFVNTTKQKNKELLEKLKNISLENTIIIKPHERIAGVTLLNTDEDFFGLDYQNDLIREKTIDETMLKIHKSQYKKFMIDSDSGKLYWQIDKIYWSNMFCYKDENFLDFSDLQGLTTIIGKNGLGKTSLINIICLGLYGMLSNNDPLKPQDLAKLTKNICHTGYDRWNVVLYFSTFNKIVDTDSETSEKSVNSEKSEKSEKIEKKSYIIKRNGNEKEVVLSFFEIIGEGKTVQIVNKTAYTNEITQNSISEIIGFPNDFLTTNVMPQNTKYYVDRTPQEITDSIIISSYANKFKQIEEDVVKTMLHIKGLIKKKSLEISGATELVGTNNLDEQANNKKIEDLEAELIIVKARLVEAEREYNNIPKIKGDINEKDYTELAMFYNSIDETTNLQNLVKILDKLTPEKPEYFIKYAEKIVLNIDKYEEDLKKYGIKTTEVAQIYSKARDNSLQKIEATLTNSKLVPKLENPWLVKSRMTNLTKIDKNSEEYMSYKKFIDKNGGFANFEIIKNFITRLLELVTDYDAPLIKFSPEIITEVGNYNLILLNNRDILDVFEFDNKCQCCIKNRGKLDINSEKEAKIKLFIKTYIVGHYTDYTVAQNNIMLAEKLKFLKTISEEKMIGIENFQKWSASNPDVNLESHVKKIINMQITDSYVLEYINSMGIELYREKVEGLSKNSAILRESYDNILAKITKIKQVIINSKKIAQSKTELEQLSMKLEKFDKYLKIVKKDGICKNIIESYLSKLNKGINNILHCITDFTVNIQLEQNNLLNITIPEKNINARQCSGGQKFILDIAIRISLLNISKNRPRFMIIDEGFGSLDTDHLENIQIFMQIIDKFYIEQKNWILFVSHINELKDLSNNKITIDMINNRSFIINVTEEELQRNRKLILALGNTKSANEPSMNDYTYNESTDKYYCKYCQKDYTYGRTMGHLQTAVHKKNYIESQINADN